MAAAIQTQDHDEIREWVEARGGVPAIVKGTEGLLRIDFVEGPRSGGHEPTLEEVDWETWFEKFDENDLVFLYSPEKKSRFFKLISEETAAESRAGHGEETQPQA